MPAAVCRPTKNLCSLIDRAQFGTSPIIAESLWQRVLQATATKRFFRRSGKPTIWPRAFSRDFSANRGALAFYRRSRKHTSTADRSARASKTSTSAPISIGIASRSRQSSRRSSTGKNSTISTRRDRQQKDPLGAKPPSAFFHARRRVSG